MPLVAVVTCREFPDLDDEDRLLIPALAELGIDAVPAVWTDETVDWSSFSLVVIRETWDYAEHREEFLAWTRAVSDVSVLANRAELVEWNTDKRYLAELVAKVVNATRGTVTDLRDTPETVHLGLRKECVAVDLPGGWTA